jgi:hypothetical protein
MSGQKIIQGLKEALDHAYSEQPDWCPPAVWAEAKGWVEAHLSMQATGAASASLPVVIVAKAILAAKAEEREGIAQMADALADLFDGHAIRCSNELDIVEANAAESAMRKFAVDLRREG